MELDRRGYSHHDTSAWYQSYEILQQESSQLHFPESSQSPIATTLQAIILFSSKLQQDRP